MSAPAARKKCFVISPIDEPNSEVRKHADRVFKYVIQPALNACEIDPVRSDHMTEPGRISDQMFRAIFEHDLCIAILTFANPNVYYELALAQSANRPVLILIEQGLPMPFDVKDFRTVPYDLHIESYEERKHIDLLIEFVREVERRGWRGDDVFAAYRGSGVTGARKTTDELFGRETDERRVMVGAERELWLVQETGNLLAEKAKTEVLTLLRRGGRVLATCTAPTDNVARLMALRNANLSSQTILKRASLAVDHLDDLLKQAGSDAERFSLRYIAYPIGATLAVADPSHDDPARRRALVRLAGFKTPFVQKLDLEVSSVDAPETFDALAREARRLLMHSAKVMLLVGPPRSGKTTLLSRIVEERRDHPGLFFLLSTARWAERERLGFDYTSSAQPAPVPFAERQPSGTYDVLTQALDPAIAHMGKAQSEGKVLLVDEIGPMQLRNEAFRKCIEDLVNDPRVSLLASLAEPQQCIGAARVFVESLMRHRRSTVLRLSGPEDTEPLRRELQEELDAALLLAAQMPREAWG